MSSYEPRRASESRFLDIRRLRYHVRHWSAAGAPKVVLLHGYMDVSASFQFLVDALRGDWDVYAPDWRATGSPTAAAPTATGFPTTWRTSTRSSGNSRPASRSP